MTANLKENTRGDEMKSTTRDDHKINGAVPKKLSDVVADIWRCTAPYSTYLTAMRGCERTSASI